MGVFGQTAIGRTADAAAGVDILRSGKVGFFASLRADAPLYALEGTKYGPSGGYGYALAGTVKAYAVPMSLNAGLSFR